MTAQDAYWAAKIIVRFDDTLLRAIVDTAEYSDPAATEYIVKTLAERRDKIGRYWFSRVNALDEFEVSDEGTLLAVDGETVATTATGATVGALVGVNTGGGVETGAGVETGGGGGAGGGAADWPGAASV